MRSKNLGKGALAACAAIALFLAGCETTWNYAKGPVTPASKLYSITFPQGWTYIALSDEYGYISTYDGPSLQSIIVKQQSIKKDLPFSEEKLAADMDAEKLVDAYYKNAYNNPNYKGVAMERAGPAALGGVEGFELAYSYTVESGLRYRESVTGAISKGELVTVTFRAPTRHYYDRDDDVMPSVLASFAFK